MPTTLVHGVEVEYGTPPYPIPPFLWLLNGVDLLCGAPVVPKFADGSSASVFGLTFEGVCPEWRRDWFGIEQTLSSITELSSPEEASKVSWLSYKVPSVFTSYRPLLSFDDFVEQKQQEGFDYGGDGDSLLSVMKSKLSLLYEYMFWTNDTELGDLSTGTSLIALVIILIVLQRCKHQYVMPAFSRLGRSLAVRSHGEQWADDNRDRLHKFGEYFYRFLFHTAITVFGFLCFHKDDFFPFSSENQSNPMSEGGLYLYYKYPLQTITPAMCWYYLFQAAYNFDAMFSLLRLSFTVRWNWTTLSNLLATATKTQRDQNDKHNPKKTDGGGNIASADAGVSAWLCPPFTIKWKETARGDFNEMFIHHIATNWLVIMSSFCRLTRCGSMVFLVHDASDVFVDMSKLANFMRYKKATFVCFCCMCCVWAYTRMYILPVYIYYELYFNSEALLHEKLPVLIYICYRHLFYASMKALITLHYVWFFMFVKMFSTFLRKRECHDYSEHKKGEKQDHHKKGDKTDVSKTGVVSNGDSDKVVSNGIKED